MPDSTTCPNLITPLYLSQRQSNTINRSERALKKVLTVQSDLHDSSRFMGKITPSGAFLEWTVVDYLIWALKRYLTKEDNRRYFKALEHKFAEIYDVYGNNGRGEIHNAQKPFDLFKTGPFGVK